MHILHVVGARPNFMKAAPVLRALTAAGVLRQTLVHTGQHYDRVMSEVFFRQLEMPEPDCDLGVGSGSHARQTADIMRGLESIVLERNPDLVLVYGDVNSTVAAALVCAKLGIRIGHVEAGLRSHDRSMPEEINRLLTDQISDLLFTPSPDADENLIREGIEAGRIHLVGNVMIDTLLRLLPRSEQFQRADLPSPYALVTLHRPSNVDDLPWLGGLMETLTELSEYLTIVFPVHPRTRRRLEELRKAGAGNERLWILEPLPYLEFLALQRRATVVITDSGGIQEETTMLGVPCLTVRENTERPITLTLGTNQLVGRNLARLRDAVERILRQGPEAKDKRKQSVARVPLWDGHAAQRIAETIVQASSDQNKGRRGSD